MYPILLGIALFYGCYKFLFEGKSDINVALFFYMINNLIALVFACIVSYLNQIDFENIRIMMTNSNQCLDTIS